MKKSEIRNMVKEELLKERPAEGEEIVDKVFRGIERTIGSNATNKILKSYSVDLAFEFAHIINNINDGKLLTGKVFNVLRKLKIK